MFSVGQEAPDMCLFCLVMMRQTVKRSRATYQYLYVNFIRPLHEVDPWAVNMEFCLCWTA